MMDKTTFFSFLQRLVVSIFYAALLNFLVWLLIMLVAVFQYGSLLIIGKRNIEALKFSGYLYGFTRQILEYLLLYTDDIPFPVTTLSLHMPKDLNGSFQEVYTPEKSDEPTPVQEDSDIVKAAKAANLKEEPVTIKSKRAPEAPAKNINDSQDAETKADVASTKSAESQAEAKKPAEASNTGSATDAVEDASKTEGAEQKPAAQEDPKDSTAK